MSEIEKMYKLVDVQPYYKKRIECKEGYPIGQPCGKSPCIDCDKSIFEDVMPPFTAEKQIELIKWLAIRLDFGLEYYQDKTWAVQTQLGWDGYEKQYEHKNFDEAISGLINRLWQDLTEEEKQQVKGILE